ncbi:MAG TPA: NAD(P)/FAD-dependent oxidoreductase [Steroidobacteraceae bacterium]|nr:NAD(P)/FAD-dependent oxidoreductase [Steroidobacteraceae bacterium]
MTASVSTVWDVAIVGAGPAGSATARRLAQRGCHVLLIEGSRFDESRVGESLAPAVKPLLQALGVWPAFMQLEPVPSYGTRSLWGRDLPEDHSHLMTPYECGWHVERHRFDRMLAQSAVDAGAALHLGARVTGCETTTAGFELRLTDGCSREDRGAVQVRFVVDATGRRTALARFMRARHKTFDRLIGVGTEFEDCTADAHRYTLVETSPLGWWYAAPLTHRRSMVMLMGDADLLQRSGVMQEHGWQTELSATTLLRERVGSAHARRAVRSFCAVSQRLMRDPAGASNWLAVGDAALAVDPISGSGVIRALRTAEAASSAIVETLSGNSNAIPTYEHARNRECTEYLFERVGYYDLEHRWQTTFWHRRRAAAENALALVG